MATALAEPLISELYLGATSAFSMAAAITLADFFGTDNISFCTDADPNAHDAANNPFAEARCFTAAFTAAAFEAGGSRLIGGIHFPSDNIQGLAAGERIAREVVGKRFPAGTRAIVYSVTGDFDSIHRGAIGDPVLVEH